MDKDHTNVTNTYPAGYPINTGGTATADGVAPNDFTPAMPYKDYGGLRVYGAKDRDISYDASSQTLTIKAGSGIKISMENPAAASATVEKLVLGETGGTGTVGAVLDGVRLGGSKTLTIQQSADVTYEQDNDFGKIDLQADTVFTGTGCLKTDTFDTGNHNVNFKGGAVVVNGGSGAIAGTVTVQVDGTVIAATLTPPPAGKASIGVPFSTELSGLADITSISIDGKKYDMSLGKNQANAKLWLDPSQSHRIVFTDSQGKNKVLAAKRIDNGSGTFDHFDWGVPSKPFTVTGGTEGTDWEYTGDDGNTLLIKSGAALTISAGNSVDETGKALIGRIKVQDSLGAVDLTLDGVTSQVSTGQAFALGKGNTVSVTLADGKKNTFKSGREYAGISVGTGTSLTVKGGTAGTGELIAAGGYNGAGIGRDHTRENDQTSSIMIEGGHIAATGGDYGAGIGASDGTHFGNIKITGGSITAHGGTGGAGIGGSNAAKVGDIEIKNADVTATSQGHGAGIGGGWGSSAINGIIIIDGNSKISASSPTHGTGIGAGCQGTSGTITIKGNAVIAKAEGGEEGAGIGASWIGRCGDIIIEGKAAVNATGGDKGAGIGSGSSGSNAGKIVIDTDGVVTATGGENGVGIGSGYGGSGSTNSCGDIEIKKGTVIAQGNTDSTGIGAGRGSTSGNITIGDEKNPSNKIVVSAQGGMTNNGGNIMSYTDKDHKSPGTIQISGQGTSVRPGNVGEGLYSTSGVEVDDGNGNKIKLYSYPLCIFKHDNPDAEPVPLLESSKATDGGILDYIPLPQNAKITSIQAVGADNTTATWSPDITHAPAGDPNYVYLWMTPQDQTLTIDYTEDNGATTKQVVLNLTYFPKAGAFRVVAEQPTPPDAKPPEYTTNPGGDPDPPTPPPDPAPAPERPELEPAPPKGPGGIILQIGANYGEILEVPRFYLSAKALELNKVDISTQQNALNSMQVLRDAINRVSSIRGEYGALQNRLDHNQNDLSQAAENLTDAESRIRDADMAEEYTKLVKLNILQQSAQSMLSHSNQDVNRVMQLFQ